MFTTKGHYINNRIEAVKVIRYFFFTKQYEINKFGG